MLKEVASTGHGGLA